jgi:porphobilinogen synthase
LVAETNLTTDRLILPLFVDEGQGEPSEIESLPGHMSWAPEQMAKPAREAAEAGIPAVLVFGVPAVKDEVGSQAYNPKGVVQRAVAAIKREVPDLIVITDVCLCQYTSHGHCGVVSEAGEILNDPTLELISKTALSHAQAGADIVAPSGMMDGTVRAIREVLDESGFQQTAIMAYSAKYASAFYGPFREAADSAPQFGDRRSYQLDPRNAREALREIALDVAEGADIVMVKPALAYLDVIRRASMSVNIPLAAYNVSGEYAMVKAAVAKGLMDERLGVLEILTAIRRAGADMIITYHAKDVAKWLAG